MIFAHGPAGFLSAWLLKKFWLKQKKFTCLYLLAFLGGIFPDFDLFYYYLVNAANSHREMFSHSLFFYLIIFFIIYLIGFLKKKQFIKVGIIVFSLGILTHLLTDSLGAGIALLYPFSNHLYGFARFTWFDQSLLGQNLFATNYILEVFILIHVVLIIIWWIIKAEWLRKLFLVLLEIILIIAIIFISIINNHVFKGESYIYYGDLDNDKIVNKKDIDMDGDGVSNFLDNDANANGINNQAEIIDYIQQSKNVWYDSTEGGLLEIPLRMGLVTQSEFVKRIFESTGIYFRKEMRDDFTNNPLGYLNTPKQSDFDRQIQNWHAWLEHQGRLLPSERENYKVGRIVFYGRQRDQLTHVAIITEVNKDMIIVADAVPYKNVRLVSEQVVMQEFGAAQYIGLIYRD